MRRALVPAAIWAAIVVIGACSSEMTQRDEVMPENRGAPGAEAGDGGAVASDAGAKPALEWPNAESKATSDAWLALHHDALTKMRPRVFAINLDDDPKTRSNVREGRRARGVAAHERRSGRVHLSGRLEGRTVRVPFINSTRGPGCALHSAGHGYEWMARSRAVPELELRFSAFANFDLEAKHATPFADWYACDAPDCITFTGPNALTWKVGSQTGTIAKYDQACGNVHFAPNARAHYDERATRSSRRTAAAPGRSTGDRASPASTTRPPTRRASRCATGGRTSSTDPAGSLAPRATGGRTGDQRRRVAKHFHM